MLDLELLVCAATPMELATFGTHDARAQTMLTGVGIPQALAETLMTADRLRPRRIVNIGIAGAYPGSGLQIGDIVTAIFETYGDVGFELPEPPGFQSINESLWGEFYQTPLPLVQFAEFPSTRSGIGCTVNACTGTVKTGQAREAAFGADFETMEGAAVAQAGQILEIPVCEIRAISNIASTRDMRPENIRLALANLTAYFDHCRKNNYD